MDRAIEAAECGVRGHPKGIRRHSKVSRRYSKASPAIRQAADSIRKHRKARPVEGIRRHFRPMCGLGNAFDDVRSACTFALLFDVGLELVKRPARGTSIYESVYKRLHIEPLHIEPLHWDSTSSLYIEPLHIVYTPCSIITPHHLQVRPLRLFAPCAFCTINSTFLCLNFSTLNLCDLQSSNLLKSYLKLLNFCENFRTPATWLGRCAIWPTHVRIDEFRKLENFKI